MSLNRNLILICAAAIILSSCHSRKAALKSDSGVAAGPPTYITDPTRMVVKRIPPEHIIPSADIIDKYSQLMGVKKNDITDGRLYNFIEEWAGTPYKFGGLDKAGIDCSGFTLLLEQQVYAISVPRTTKLQVSVINRKYENELKEGDLVFFDFDGKPFSHVGVYLQNGYVVHASTTKGVIVVPLHGAIYKYFTRAGSVPFIDSVVVAQN